MVNWKKHNDVKDIIGDLLFTEIKILGPPTKYTHNYNHKPQRIEK